MMRTNNVYFVKGNHKVAPMITLGEYERINADHVVIITILKYPQYAPDGWDSEMTMPNSEMIMEFLEVLEKEDQTHLVHSEYAQFALNRGGSGIRAVEGVALNCDWLYCTISALHRGFGKKITDLLPDPPDWIMVDDMLHSWDETISSLKPHDYLG